MPSAMLPIRWELRLPGQRLSASRRELRSTEMPLTSISSRRFAKQLSWKICWRLPKKAGNSLLELWRIRLAQKKLRNDLLPGKVVLDSIWFLCLLCVCPAHGWFPPTRLATVASFSVRQQFAFCCHQRHRLLRLGVDSIQ